MLSIEEVRALLPENETYTDEQVEEIRNSFYELAQLAFDVWLAEQNQKNSPKK